MVTVLQVGQLKYKINQKDHNPPHVHVEGGGASVRINLRTFEMMDERTEFSQAMVVKIIAYIKDHQQELVEKWIEFHGKTN